MFGSRLIFPNAPANWISDARQSDAPLSALDRVATALFLLLVLGEAVADAQMFAFQSEKYRRKAAKATEVAGDDMFIHSSPCWEWEDVEAAGSSSSFCGCNCLGF